MKKYLIPIFILAFVLRFISAHWAYHGDLNNNLSWGQIGFNEGFINYYERESWPFSAPNQPPLTIFMFTTLFGIWKRVLDLSWILNNNISFFPSSFIWYWELNGQTILAKLPSIFADLAIGYLIIHFFKKDKKQKLGILLSTIWLFNPITWYNSSIWGQTDSIVNLFGLISFYYLLKKNIVKSAFFLTVSLLFKGSLAIFVPIFITFAIFQKIKLESYIKSVILCSLFIVMVSIFFHPYIDLPVWFINLYKNRIFTGEIGFLTANAFNFWWLVDPGRTKDSILYFGIPARAWGYAIVFTIFFVSFYKLRKKVTKISLLYVFSIVGLATFSFLTKIHERYMYPLFPFLTLLIGYVPKLALVYGILSLTYLLNMYHMFWQPSLPFLESTFQNAEFARLLSMTNLLVLLSLISFYWNYDEQN